MSRAVPRYKRTNPPLTPIGAAGCVEYKILGLLEGQMTVSTFMYSGLNANPTVTALNTLLTNIRANIFNNYKACLSSDWVCTSERLDVVHTNTIAGVTSATNAGAVGGRSAGHLPTEVALVIQRNTGFKGQHGRGRVSLPAVAVADVTNSTVVAAALITALNTLGTSMLSSASDGTNSWASVIGQRSTTPPKLIIGVSALVSVTPKTLLGTIRRRKIGRGK